MQSAAAEYKAQHSDRVAGHLRQLADSVSAVTLQEEGSLVRMIGIKLEAIGCQAPIGRRCRIITDEGGSIEAEVVDSRTALST